MVIEYADHWSCDLHNEEFTSEGLCPGCYDEMQHGDAFMADKADD